MREINLFRAASFLPSPSVTPRLLFDRHPGQAAARVVGRPAIPIRRAIRERPVLVVDVQLVRRGTAGRDVQILPAVAVEIASGSPAGVVCVREARRGEERGDSRRDGGLLKRRRNTTDASWALLVVAGSSITSLSGNRPGV